MKIKAALETEAFINSNGYYAIKQADAFGKDVIVELTPDQMRALVNHMRFYIKTRDEWFQPTEVE